MADQEPYSPWNNATFSEWFATFSDLKQLWREQPTNYVHEFDFFLGGLLTLIHALKTGGRYPFLWLTTIFHGVVLETIVYNLKDYDNFWHAQSSIVFTGGRLPMHIMLLYPSFIYTSSVAVSHLRLPKFVEPLVVGVGVVLIDMPYDIMGIKLMWWVWHDTDANVYDRHYWVPWTSYYFHTTFAASLTLSILLLRKAIVNKDRYDAQRGSVPKELLVCFLAGFCGMPGGILQFAPLYHPLHDVFGIHTENIVFFLIMSIGLMAWSFDRKRTSESQPSKGTIVDCGILKLYLAIHYLIYVFLVIFARPENAISVGLHEPTGPCDKLSPIRTPIGQVLYKRKFLCVDDFDEPFDWHCLPDGKPPPHGLSWYTVCGTPYPNHAEYIFVITAVCAFASFIYYQILFRSGPLMLTKVNLIKGKVKSK